MGCAQSKIENEEAVTRCKERKQFMKDAVAARNAFAAAHSSYAMALKNTGAALSDYTHGEFYVSSHSAVAGVIPSSSSPPSSSAAASSSIASTSAAGIPQPIPDTLPPPPPPPPLSLQRAATMPEINARSGGPSGVGLNGPIIEEDGTLDEDENSDSETRERLVRKSRSRGGSSRGTKMEETQEAPPPPPPSVAAEKRATPPPQQQPYFDYFFPNVENMPGTTLEEAPPPPPPLETPPPPPHRPPSPVSEEEEPVIARKSLDKRSNRMEDINGMAETEAQNAAMGVGGSGRGMKKNKATMGMAGERKMSRVPTNLVNAFTELDDNFLKASEYAYEVSKMLEATKLHYHSNFADNRGHIDHSARLMRVITWNRSFRGLPNADEGKDNYDYEENETHATVLDKLLAWEKKLYDEVKAGEVMKFEYQKKVSHLNKVKKRGGSSESEERAKAAVSHLHTRYIVDMQSMDSTVSEINRLRDEQLYPRLVHLVHAMEKMWEMMQIHHQRQAEVSKALKYLDASQAVKETDDHHHERTIQLLAVVQEWHTQFCRMIDHQKEYIKFLNSWLKLNLIPIESTLKEKVSSPPRVTTPPIQRLVIAWYDRLEKLPDEIARTAIINFAAVISTIMQQQEEEIRLRDKCEETRRELSRKTRQFEDWYHKYMQKIIPDENDDSVHKDAVIDRQFSVEQVKKRLEEEEEMYRKQCVHVREKTSASLRTRLPELFQAMSEVGYACSDMYRTLRYSTQRRHQNESQNTAQSS